MDVRNNRVVALSFLLLVTAFPVLNIVFPHLFWEHRLIMSYPAHSAIEAVGAFAAIFMGFLSVQWLSGSDNPRYIFISLGFLSMGIFDLFHSTILPGNGFVLFHSLALLAGGAMFSLVWLPVSNRILEHHIAIKVGSAMLLSIISIFIVMKRSLLPEMIINNEFTASAGLLNVTAGLLFLASAIRLYLNYLRDGSTGLLLLTAVAILSASAGLIFPFSEAWSDGWWFWHGLRLSSYLLLLIFVITRNEKTLQDYKNTLTLLEAKHRETLSLFNGIEDVIYVSDPKTYELVYVNDTFEKIWGKDIIGKQCYAVLQNRQSPCPFCTNDKILGESLGSPYLWEFQNEVTGAWFRCADKAIQWPDGRMLRFEMATDITAQKQNQEEVIRERQFSDTLIDSLPGIFYMFDMEGRFVRWNKNFETVTEYSHDEVLKMNPLDFFRAENRQIVAEGIGRVFKDGKADVEAVFSTKTGMQIPHTLTGVMIELDKKPYLAGVGVDIADRKKFENELLESEEKFRRLITSAPIPLCFVDLDGRLNTINDRFISTFGYILEDIPDIDTWWLLAYPDESYRQWAMDTWNEAVEQSKKQHSDIQPIEYRITCKNGDTRIIEVGGIMLEKGLLATFIDVTERRQAEENLKRLNKNLERSNKELEQFAYVASHDLQEPLRMVASYTQLLAKRYEGRLDEKADKFIGYAVEGATRMQTLINDLLHLSRIGTRANPFEKTDCREVLDIVIKNLETAIQTSGCRVEFSEMPEIMADKIQLGQVFQNLIENAIKFRGESPLLVKVFARQEEHEWLFEVKDNGIGIEPQFHERIFTVFQRLHARGKYSGNGMGLSIAKKIVDRHNGRIWVESNPEGGSCFFFTISRNLEQRSDFND